MTPEAPLKMQDRAVRRRPGRKSPVLWLSVLLALVLAGWGSVYVVRAAFAPTGCERRIPVEVVAAPAIAQTVADIARAGADPRKCVDVTVVARDSAQFADALANPPPGQQPQVWIPESTFWLGRAQAGGAFTFPDRAPRSPAPGRRRDDRGGRGQLGWPAQPVPWSALLGPQATTLPVGIPDPAADPIGIAGLVGVQAITAALPDAGAAESRCCAGSASTW